MADDAPKPIRRRKVATVDKEGAGEPSSQGKPSRVAELEAQVARLSKDLADAKRAVEALRKR